MADKAISFATFNTLNMARAGQITYEDERPATAQQERDKIAWVSGKLREMQADVIGFQEIWSPDMLADCFTAAGLDYEIVARPAPVGQVQVALAARRGLLMGPGRFVSEFPPEVVFRKRPPPPGRPVEDVSVRIESFSRPVLVADIAPDIRVMVAHLKSKRPTPLDAQEAADPEIRRNSYAIGSALSLFRRAAEGVAMRAMLNEEMTGNDRPFVVLGDLNDAVRAVSTVIVSAEPRYRLFASDRSKARADFGLYSTHDLQDFRSIDARGYTYIYEGLQEILDHILVSEQFYDNSEQRRWSFRNLKVWNDHLDTPRRAPGSTDHGILRAAFDANPAPPRV